MIRLLFLAPVLLLLILFALSNQAPVSLTLWPTDFSIDVPVSLAMLSGMGLAFLAGALVVWPSAVAARVRAGRAERRAARLEAEQQPKPAPLSRVPALPGR